MISDINDIRNSKEVIEAVKKGEDVAAIVCDKATTIVSEAYSKIRKFF